MHFSESYIKCLGIHIAPKPLKGIRILHFLAKHFIIIDDTCRTKNFILGIGPIFSVFCYTGLALCSITSAAFAIEPALIVMAYQTVALLATVIEALIKTGRTEIIITVTTKAIVIHDTWTTVG